MGWLAVLCVFSSLRNKSDETAPSAFEGVNWALRVFTNFDKRLFISCNDTNRLVEDFGFAGVQCETNSVVSNYNQLQVPLRG